MAVQRGLNLGVALFIVSEGLFFLAIFWAFFHSALSPTVELGAMWPPLGIEAINPFELPLLNTVLLLSSGITVTYAHHSLIQGNRSGALYGLVFTIILAVIFTGLTIIFVLFFIVGFIKWSLYNYYNSATVAKRTCPRVCSTLRAFPASQPLVLSMGQCTKTGKLTLPLRVKRLYTTAVVEPKLSPYWVTGFCDAESSFSLKVSKSSTTRTGWNVVPEFQITLHSRDLLLLRKIHSFLGIGVVREREDINQAYYSVQSARAIANVIIPHFDKYPLITQKKADYLLFKQAVNLLLEGQARSSIEGLHKILSIKGSMNIGLSDKLKLNFPTVLPLPRPIVSGQYIPHPNWLIGFIDGEGFFYVKSLKNQNYSTGFNVTMVFSIYQHVRDESLLTKFIEYLGCGRIEKASTRPNEIKFSVSKFKDIKEKIIPFFYSYSLQGIKYMDYLDFVKVAKIIEDKGHLSLEGINKINSLKSGMNSGRTYN